MNGAVKFIVRNAGTREIIAEGYRDGFNTWIRGVSLGSGLAAVKAAARRLWKDGRLASVPACGLLYVVERTGR